MRVTRRIARQYIHLLGGTLRPTGECNHKGQELVVRFGDQLCYYTQDPKDAVDMARTMVNPNPEAEEYLHGAIWGAARKAGRV